MDLPYACRQGQCVSCAGDRAVVDSEDYVVTVIQSEPSATARAFGDRHIATRQRLKTATRASTRW